MNEKGKKLKGYLLSLTLLASIFIFSMGIMPSAQAQIVIIGSPYSSDDPLPQDYLADAKGIANMLKAKGYTGNKLVELYGKDATSTNILKAMYNADAVIYIGHGGYQYGHYDMKGGTATAPFSLVGSESSDGSEYIWGIGDKMRQGWSGSLFTAPLKPNSAAFLFHACFSTGDVGGTQVKNSAETIYNFSKMFTGAGASYYASAYYGGDIIKEFLDGATSLSDANSKLDYFGEKLNSTAIPIGGTNIWRSNDRSVAFTGNWAYKFPIASQVSDYNPVAAAAWYAGDKTKLLVSAFTSAQNYIPTEVTFKEYSCDVLDTIVKWTWDFGDGSDPIEFYNTTNQSVIHNYASLGNYNVTHTVTNSKNQVSTSTKTISVQNRAPVSGFTVSPSNPAVKGLVTFNSTSYDPDYNDSITSWYWNFGDGTSASGQTVKHAFTKEGYFKVALTTKDTTGKSSATSKTIKVGNPKPDLVITSIKRSGSTRYITIKNQGTFTSSGSYVRIWNGKYSYKRYKQVYVKALSPGASTKVKITRFYYYHGTAKVDYYNKISEKSETNNIRRF